MTDEAIDEEIEALLYAQVYHADSGDCENPTENLGDFGQSADLLPTISQENWTEILPEEVKEQETAGKSEPKEPSLEPITKPKSPENYPDIKENFHKPPETLLVITENLHINSPPTQPFKHRTTPNIITESIQSRIQAYRKSRLFTKTCAKDVRRFKSGSINEEELIERLNKEASRIIPRRHYGLRGTVDTSDLISLDSSDNSDIEFVGIENPKMSEKPTETVVVDSSADEDELIFIPPPPVPVIAIEDESDGEIPGELEPPHDETSNDFLTPAPLDNSNFNFSLHGSEFQDQEFARPANPDADEYESSASTSDINRDFSNTIKTITFNEVDFPKDLFEDNLDRFGEMITPRRPVEDQNSPVVNEVSQKTKRANTKTSSESSSESDYDASETHKNLPELSPMIVEIAAPKAKTKKKKKKEGSETPATTVGVEGKKKKKKKRLVGKMKKTSSEENNDEVEDKAKKKKKKKKSLLTDSILEQEEDGEAKKKNKKRQSEDGDLPQQVAEEQKKKRKKHSEEAEPFDGTDPDSQVVDDQKKRKKRQSLDLEPIDEVIELDHSQATEEQKKRKKRQSQDVAPIDEVTAMEPEEQKKRKKKQSQEVAPIDEVTELDPEDQKKRKNRQSLNVEPIDEVDEDLKKRKKRSDNEVLTEEGDGKNEEILIPQSNYQEMAGKKVVVQGEEDEDVVIVEKPIPTHVITSESEFSDDDILNVDDVGELSLANVETNEDKPEKEDFDVDQIKNKMSDDPQKWKILDVDVYNLSVSRRGPRCHKCREFGHLINKCPKRIQINCSLCGFEGHSDARCPNKVCFTCGRPGDYSTVYCYRCSDMRKMVCQICSMSGHQGDNCPDLWRRYFLTTRDGPPVTSKVKKKHLLKPRDKQWCSGCANKGHLDYECRTYLREYPACSPYIFDYKDLYKTTPEADLRTVLEQRRDYPSTSTPKHQRLNPVSLLQRTPHQSVLNPYSIMRPQVFPQVDPQILAGQLMAMAMEQQPEQYNAPGYGERHLFEFTQNTYTTPQMPPEDFVPLESLQPVRPEFNIVVENIDESIKQKFISETVPKLQQFVSKEIRKMESNRIRDIKQCKKRLYISSSLRKNAPSASLTKQLYGLFRSINMHLFGVRKLARGKEKLDFLRNFVSNPGKNLTGSKREALLEAYGYIFGGEHPNFNYRKHVNALCVKEK